MWIKKLFIDGFKGFEKDFSLDFTPNKNIIIGKNGVGKTTILQAINLVLQQRGVVTFGNGSLSYANYINSAILSSSLSKARTQLADFTDEDLPQMTIAVELEPDDQSDPKYSDFLGYNYPNLMYDNKSEARYGIQFEYKFDKFFENDFENYVKSFISENKKEDNFEIPFEFYSVSWITFAGQNYNAAKDPLKSILIDNDAFTGNPYNMFAQTLYATMGQIPQLHSRINFRNESKKVNFPLSGQNEENYQLLINPNSVDLERIVDVKDKQKDIYIRDLGSGEENLIKTKLSLKSKSSLIMIEEPENHLTAEKTREQLELIKSESKAKQLIITTHNPEIITTLDLKNSIWLSKYDNQPFITKMKKLPSDTIDFFNRRDDLDFLRIITAKRIIIVEGAAEYVLMRVFLRNAGYTEVQINSVEIISMVGRYYKPFNDLAGLVNNKLAVITDNDGEDKRIKKIKEDNDKYSNVRIFTPNNTNVWTFEVAIFAKNYDYFMDDQDFKESEVGSSFNKTYTERLENLVKAYPTVGKKLSYLLRDKTRSTKLFLRKDKDKKLEVPDYISDSFKWLFDEN